MTLKKLIFILSLAVMLTGGILVYVYLYQPYQQQAQQRQAGVEAFNKFEYKKAYQLWLPLARAGDGKAQSNIAGIYLAGQGKAQSFLLAYVWIRLAEYNGDTGTESIHRIAKSNLTSDELSEAEELIQNCLATHYKDCH